MQEKHGPAIKEATASLAVEESMSVHSTRPGSFRLNQEEGAVESPNEEIVIHPDGDPRTMGGLSVLV